MLRFPGFEPPLPLFATHYDIPMTPSAPPGEQESEWQFATPDIPAVADWLAQASHPGFRVTHRTRKRIRDTYYDTADWRIHRASYTCRLRRLGDEAEVTLKSMAAAVDGLRQRHEITERFPFMDGETAHGAPEGSDGEPDLRSLPGPVGEILRAVAGEHPLRQLFVIETDRQVFDLADDEGALGEIALDSTAVLTDGEIDSTRIGRVEVEVESLERALSFVEHLRKDANLEEAKTSKFETGLLATGQAVAYPWQDLGRTEPGPGMSAADFATAVLRKQVARLLAMEPGTRLGHDPGPVHDMRVASCRIRATLAAFDAYLPDALRRLRDDMRWLSHSLGDVRDVDVLRERLADWRKQLPHVPSHTFDSLEDLVADQRTRARKRTLRALDSARYERLVARLVSSLQSHASGATEGTDVQQVLLPLLEKRYQRVRELGDQVGPLSSPADFHQLRIAAKKLRYTNELAIPLYGRPVQRFGTRLARLQDLLGLHQDTQVTIESLIALALKNHRHLGPDGLIAVGRIGEYGRRCAGEYRARFPAIYGRIGRAPWPD